MTQPTFMRTEIEEIPQAVARLLEQSRTSLVEGGRLLRQRDPANLVTIARGSSDHASAFIKYAVELGAGLPVASALHAYREPDGYQPVLDALRDFSSRLDDVASALERGDRELSGCELLDGIEQAGRCDEPEQVRAFVQALPQAVAAVREALHSVA